CCLDEDDAVLGGALPGELQGALAHPFGKAAGIGSVEAKLNGGGHLVDVLPAGTGGTDERLFQLVGIDDGFPANDDVVFDCHVSTHAAWEPKRKGPIDTGPFAVAVCAPYSAASCT